MSDGIKLIGYSSDHEKPLWAIKGRGTQFAKWIDCVTVIPLPDGEKLMSHKEMNAK